MQRNTAVTSAVTPHPAHLPQESSPPLEISDRQMTQQLCKFSSICMQLVCDVINEQFAPRICPAHLSGRPVEMSDCTVTDEGYLGHLLPVSPHDCQLLEVRSYVINARRAVTRRRRHALPCPVEAHVQHLTTVC